MLDMNITTIILVLGGLVFLVNLVVEVTKNLWPLNTVHTNFYVVGLSILLTVLSYFVYISYNSSKVIWYYLIAEIVCGCVVAYLAMFGWDKLIKLWKQSQKGE